MCLFIGRNKSPKWVGIDTMNFDLKSFVSSEICVLFFCVHELCNHSASLCLRLNTVCQVSAKDRALSKHRLFVPFPSFCHLDLTLTAILPFVSFAAFFPLPLISRCHPYLLSKPFSEFHLLISDIIGNKLPAFFPFVFKQNPWNLKKLAR